MNNFEKIFSGYDENELIDDFENNDFKDHFNSFYESEEESLNETEYDIDDDLPEIPNLEE